MNQEHVPVPQPALGTVLWQREVLPQAYLLCLQAPQSAAQAGPGQFFMLRCGKGYDPLLRRPLSLHGLGPGQVLFLYQLVGKGTQWLSQRQPGDRIDLLGPLGRGFQVEPGPGTLLLVAGGMGIAPLAALAQHAVAQGRAAIMLLGAPQASQVYPRELLPRQIEVVVATDDGSLGRKGMVTQLIPEFWDRAVQVFACGPPAMYRAMAGMDLSGKSVQVLLEERMACGLGGCYGCTIQTPQGPKLVCRDGPMFELGEVFPTRQT